MLEELARRNGLSPDEINLVVVAGNTAMTHIFTGLNPAGIAAHPLFRLIPVCFQDGQLNSGLIFLKAAALYCRGYHPMLVPT